MVDVREIIACGFFYFMVSSLTFTSLTHLKFTFVDTNTEFSGSVINRKHNRNMHMIDA